MRCVNFADWRHSRSFADRLRGQTVRRSSGGTRRPGGGFSDTSGVHELYDLLVQFRRLNVIMCKTPVDVACMSQKHTLQVATDRIQPTRNGTRLSEDSAVGYDTPCRTRNSARQKMMR